LNLKKGVKSLPLREGWDGCRGVDENEKAINRFRIKCGKSRLKLPPFRAGERSGKMKMKMNVFSKAIIKKIAVLSFGKDLG
jgi:hypothetical protein